MKKAINQHKQMAMGSKSQSTSGGKACYKDGGMVFGKEKDQKKKEKK